MLEPSWVGRRVTVRRVVDRAPDGTVRLGDVVGELAGLDAQTAVVESRNGPVEVPLALVTAARLALPSTADELALTGVLADSWRPAERAELGGWVLQANAGFSRRANSVLPLRAPGMPLPEALDRAGEWYAARGLPLILQVPTEARRLLDAELAEEGWQADAPTDVLAARLDRLRADPAGGTATLAAAPDAAWLHLFGRGADTDDSIRALLTRHDRATFASVRSGDTTVAIGRGTVDRGWLGVTGLKVAPEARRQGLATAVLAALWEWGRASGATHGFVGVESDNVGARALFDRVGYWPHHDYHYRYFQTRT